jgi:hypothetical protein
MKKYGLTPFGILADPSRSKIIDAAKFGPWSLVTGASSGSLGQALHVELAKQGINVTVLMPGPTDTPALDKLGIEKPPMKPMPVAQCVTEALRALNAKRATIVPGRLIRLMVALLPTSVARDQTAKMFEAALNRKPSAAPGAAGRTS